MIAQLNERWIGMSPHTSIACVRLWGKVKSTGRPSPPNVLKDQEWGVAYGWSTGIHEVATLFALTQNPCQKWEDLGYGKAALLYQRTQHVLKAARLLPAHRRLPHQAFLSGLWWKLLSLQPLRLIAEQRLGKIADSSVLSNCRPLLWAFRRLHTTCLETAKKAMESFGLFE